MKPDFKIPLKQYRLLTSILNQDKEIYTSYNKGEMPFRINFDDLVRTLQIDADLYRRPIVELEDYGYLVRGNNIFFDAGVKAGLKSFICDVNIRTLDDRHMSQFQLMDYIPEKSEYRAHLIFFLDEFMTLSNRDGDFTAFKDDVNNLILKAGFKGQAIFEVIDFGIVELRIFTGDSNPEETFAAALKIISRSGSIRSINGLIQETYVYEDFLNQGRRY